MTNFKITTPKTPKEELQFPQFYWITAMDWIPKIGDQAFASWLKLITMADRSDKEREEDIIPLDLSRLAKKLGTSKTTLYKNVIKPLWNHGLIDLKEYHESKRKTTKPMNVIVYLHPQNDIKRMSEPLEKVRDYDEDYHSEAKTFAKRKKKKEDIQNDDTTVQKLNGATVQKLNGIKTGILVGTTVQKLNGRPFKIYTVDRLKSGHNNYSLNSFNKSLNSFSNSEEEEEGSIQSNELFKTCKSVETHNLSDRFVEEFLSAVESLEIPTFTKEQLEDTLLLVDEDKGVKNYPIWTAGKLQRLISGNLSPKPTNLSRKTRKSENRPSRNSRKDNVPEYILNPSNPSDHMTDEERAERRKKLKQLKSKYQKEDAQENENKYLKAKEREKEYGRAGISYAERKIIDNYEKNLVGSGAK